MALVWHTFEVREGGVLQTGLTPTFLHFKKLAAGFPAITPQPTIAGVGNGQYAFQFDPEVDGEASAVVDAGTAIADPAERYIAMQLGLDSSRIQSGIKPTGKVTVDVLEDKEGIKLAVDGFAAVFVEDGVDFLGATRINTAVLAGRATGAGTGIMRYFAVGAGDNADQVRLTSYTPGNGNRTETILDPTPT